MFSVSQNIHQNNLKKIDYYQTQFNMAIPA